MKVITMGNLRRRQQLINPLYIIYFFRWYLPPPKLFIHTVLPNNAIEKSTTFLPHLLLFHANKRRHHFQPSPPKLHPNTYIDWHLLILRRLKQSHIPSHKMPHPRTTVRPKERFDPTSNYPHNIFIKPATYRQPISAPNIFQLVLPD